MEAVGYSNASERLEVFIGRKAIEWRGVMHTVKVPSCVCPRRFTRPDNQPHFVESDHAVEVFALRLEAYQSPLVSCLIPHGGISS